ncbi:peptidase [Hirsutella rhossiliensis]|uniref:Peptidase family m20/M25/M40 domain-containing protein n=1 Tax=Hirsutella rhossiliensis TaxID=111463 RepID=A0A9P8SHV3_9HYPO|nr:peptidase family m20/M25/M40 domain-containing protein [Hirsutella rhossiliensis]KAH0961955.1 peptidase family m20/M25/M40 domain-containing protein [Hirsutella rhossiliensis]
MQFTPVNVFFRSVSRISRQGRVFSTFQRRLHLKINADRLQETIHETCQWGAAHRYGSRATETGMARLALSDDDARVRRWFAEEMQRLSCQVTVDQLGNMFARRLGSLRSSAPMTAMSSHLDSQPFAGRYDGILGVVAAIEALRTLNDNSHDTRYDVGVVNWTNEEGARFPKSIGASGVWAGCIPIEQAWDLRDISDPSITLKGELERHGFLGRKKIGVVLGAQAYRWLTFTVFGRNAHTGTTPLAARKDPLLAAAKMIASSNGIAKQLGALASTGVVKTPSSSSINTLASEVSFTLDLRHPQDSVVAELQERCLESFREIARQDGKGVEFSWTLDTDSPAVRFDQGCVAAVREGAVSLVGSAGWIEMTSGAGHDSVFTSRRCPTAMIFVPCKDGVSHHPEEFCSAEDCATGAQILLDSVLNYDATRTGGSR